MIQNALHFLCKIQLVLMEQLECCRVHMTQHIQSNRCLLPPLCGHYNIWVLECGKVQKTYCHISATMQRLNLLAELMSYSDLSLPAYILHKEDFITHIICHLHPCFCRAASCLPHSSHLFIDAQLHGIHNKAFQQTTCSS